MRNANALLARTPQAGKANSYEPAVARGHLVNNPGFASLMKDQELCKNLPLLNMILPLYSEQVAGAANSSAQASEN